MNAQELSIIEGKLEQNTQLIKEQHRMPKRERNQRDIDAAKVKVKIFNKWLKAN